jgi:hypothetical protein
VKYKYKDANQAIGVPGEECADWSVGATWIGDNAASEIESGRVADPPLRFCLGMM